MKISILNLNELPEFIELYLKFIHFLRDNCEEHFFNYATGIREKFTPFFERCLRNPDYAIYVAKEKNRPIGFIAGDIRYSFFPYSSIGKVGYISALFIVEEERKSGLASILENYLVTKFFMKNKLEHIVLNCLTSNEIAKKYWHKRGYETFREELRKKI